MNIYLITFKNTQDAMKAEEKYKAEGVKFSVYPTPPMILGSCGLSLRLTEDDYIEKGKGLLEKISYKAVYRFTVNGIIKVEHGNTL
jgi:hypothetical protein